MKLVREATVIPVPTPDTCRIENRMPIEKNKMRVCYVLSYRDPEYVRTRSLIQALSGMDDIELLKAVNRSPGIRRYAQTLRRVLTLRMKKDPDCYLLGFRGYEIFWIVRILTRGKTLILDHMMSPYDSLVHEKRLIREGGLGRLVRLYERSILRGADIILTDTEPHRSYLAGRFGIDTAKIHPIPVGTDEDLFTPVSEPSRGGAGALHVLFYGSFLPLHGMGVILGAARELRENPIRFTIIGGRGKTLREFHAMKERLELDNVDHIPWVPCERLPDLIREADICLGGPFGGTGQAHRVVTGKTFQGMAMGKAVIVGKTGHDHGFRDKKNCLLVAQGSERHLAEAIRWCLENRDRLPAIGGNGLKLYRKRFSIDRIRGDLRGIIRVPRPASVPAAPDTEAINVQMRYRRYKPLHDLYHSFATAPPEGVSYRIPQPIPSLRHLYPLYRAVGDNVLVRGAISGAQDLLFNRGGDDLGIDLLHYVQLVPKRIPDRPYVVDFEHIAGLANFVKPGRGFEERVSRFLNNPRCRRIIPITGAAEESFRRLFPDLYRDVEERTEVIYPALPDYHALLKGAVDHTCVGPPRDTFKLLFVGNDVYRKGLHELLCAFRKLEEKHRDMELYVISDAPRRLKGAYPSGRIHHFDPVFSREDILRKFYMPCDLFVMPTHCDTFGMALLDSLACGTPVVTTGQFAAPEIITPEINGLLARSNRLLLDEISFPSRKDTMRHITEEVEKLLVDELVEKIEHLYLKRDLLGTMGARAVRDFGSGGRFSIGVRNEKLAVVYRSCLAEGGHP